MARKMDRQYLDEHLQVVHTLESFGAAVVDLGMRMAMEQVGDGTVESIEFNLPVRIQARTLRRALSSDEAIALGEDPAKAITLGPIVIDCVTIGVGVPPFIVSYHMPV